MTTCRGCNHERHMHKSSGPCLVVSVSGPPSNEGKAVGDGYYHGGREELACWCQEYKGVNGNALENRAT